MFQKCFLIVYASETNCIAKTIVEFWWKTTEPFKAVPTMYRCGGQLYNYQVSYFRRMLCTGTKTYQIY